MNNFAKFAALSPTFYASFSMINSEALNIAIKSPWTSRYAKFLALILLYGATVRFFPA